jgi:hypothetical protein
MPARPPVPSAACPPHRRSARRRGRPGPHGPGQRRPDGRARLRRARCPHASCSPGRFDHPQRLTLACPRARRPSPRPGGARPGHRSSRHRSGHDGHPYGRHLRTRRCAGGHRRRCAGGHRWCASGRQRRPPIGWRHGLTVGCRSRRPDERGAEPERSRRRTGPCRHRLCRCRGGPRDPCQRAPHRRRPPPRGPCRRRPHPRGPCRPVPHPRGPYLRARHQRLPRPCRPAPHPPGRYLRARHRRLPRPCQRGPCQRAPHLRASSQHGPCSRWPCHRRRGQRSPCRPGCRARGGSCLPAWGRPHDRRRGPANRRPGVRARFRPPPTSQPANPRPTSSASTT